MCVRIMEQPVGGPVQHLFTTVSYKISELKGTITMAGIYDSCEVF